MAALQHIRDAKGDLPYFAWPGGYPLYYLDEEGNTLCPKCANENDAYSSELAGYDVYWEGPSIECDGGCGTFIKSAYGDPDEEEEDVELPDNA